MSERKIGDFQCKKDAEQCVAREMKTKKVHDILTENVGFLL